jgi:hypothetical protein
VSSANAGTEAYDEQRWVCVKYLYWVLAVPTGVVACLVVLLTLAGQRLSAATPAWLSLVVAAVVLGLLGWGYRLLKTGDRPGLAVLVVVLSWVVFVGSMVVNGLLHQKIWN